MAERPSLLLLGHGSRSAVGVSEYWTLVDLVHRLDPTLPIGGGFIELAQPDPHTAVRSLVARGVRSVVTVPLLLLGAGHMKNDGPAMLARARAGHPGVEFGYGRALGVDPLVLAVAAERINEATEGWESQESAVVLVGRGSYDPDANADLYKVGRLLQDTGRVAMVEPSFVSLARPSVLDALERCRRLGAANVAVVPYFLFTGVLVDRISAQSRAWRAEHPTVRVRVGRHLGPVRGVARLVLERYGEVLAGGAYMNCDCCAYRVSTSS
ncbi:MAG: sirohydrochlorin chelatase [Actinomycetota bacterium]|nr:sirohydrochlorin chelatase [Actinomycetota bacterium]